MVDEGGPEDSAMQAERERQLPDQRQAALGEQEAVEVVPEGEEGAPRPGIVGLAQRVEAVPLIREGLHPEVDRDVALRRHVSRREAAHRDEGRNAEIEGPLLAHELERVAAERKVIGNKCRCSDLDPGGDPWTGEAAQTVVNALVLEQWTGVVRQARGERAQVSVCDGGVRAYQPGDGKERVVRGDGEARLPDVRVLEIEAGEGKRPHADREPEPALTVVVERIEPGG